MPSDHILLYCGDRQQALMIITEFPQAVQCGFSSLFLYIECGTGLGSQISGFKESLDQYCFITQGLNNIFNSIKDHKGVGSVHVVI